jgi:hypothetical protein
MVRAGIPEKHAMEISGHKTRSVFERYNITDDRNTKIAGRKMERYLEELAQKVGTKEGTARSDRDSEKGANSTQIQYVRMEPPEGLEPPTRSLQNCRSAN